MCFVKKEGSLVPCAVKSLHDQSGLKDRIEFLREAALMEGIRLNAIFFLSFLSQSFSMRHFPQRTAHVVRLMGMVTKSQVANSQTTKS